MLFLFLMNTHLQLVYPHAATPSQPLAADSKKEKSRHFLSVGILLPLFVVTNPKKLRSSLVFADKGRQ